ncbi:MAG: PAS domain S-box protein [Syntrophus sp. (in: bacteria)]|nr:PAS domain S-box protein [Syntrophus sp. (in: bacteria)]
MGHIWHALSSNRTILNRAENPQFTPKRIFPFVIKASLVTLSLLIVYEILKQILFPDKRIFELDMIIIVMAGAAASLGAYSALREVSSLSQRVISELNERLKAEGQRVRAEEALKGSEAKYHSIFNNVVEGVFQRTPEGRFLSINPSLARMYGFESPEEMMKTIIDIDQQLYVNQEDIQLFRKLMDEHGFVTGFEAQRSRKDKSIFWTSTNAYVVRDADNKIVYYEGTVEDITKRKEAEERLGRTLENLRKGMGATIQTLIQVVETRDPYTAGHQQRVTDLACAIAQEMGLPEDRVDVIRMAGAVHDLGKISTPAELLSKPGKLSAKEFELIKDHSQIGYDILKKSEFPYPVPDIVHQHHERFDGLGYPQGLQGEQILLEARIIAVADVVEAILSHRPYRPELGIEMALEEILKNKGKAFDPEVVDACLKLFREKGFKF